jgi:hypothetical protein
MHRKISRIGRFEAMVRRFQICATSRNSSKPAAGPRSGGLRIDKREWPAANIALESFPAADQRRHADADFPRSGAAAAGDDESRRQVFFDGPVDLFDLTLLQANIRFHAAAKHQSFPEQAMRIIVSPMIASVDVVIDAVTGLMNRDIATPFIGEFGPPMRGEVDTDRSAAPDRCSPDRAPEPRIERVFDFSNFWATAALAGEGNPLTDLSVIARVGEIRRPPFPRIDWVILEFFHQIPPFLGA